MHPVGLPRLEPIGDRARAPEVRIEAAALLLADREAFEDSGGSAEPLPQAADRLNPRDDAERSVERATTAHRVDVRPRRDDAPAARPLDPSPHVPHRVAPDEKAGFLHPRGDELHRGSPLR